MFSQKPLAHFGRGDRENIASPQRRSDESYFIEASQVRSLLPSSPLVPSQGLPLARSPIRNHTPLYCYSTATHRYAVPISADAARARNLFIDSLSLDSHYYFFFREIL